MRRKDRELNREEALRLLGIIKEGTLCLAAGEDGYPYAVPMNCALVDGALIFHGATKGEKRDIIERDNRARLVSVIGSSLVADKLTTHYECVIAKGRIEEISDRNEAIRLLCAMTGKLFGADPQSFAEKAEKGISVTNVWRMNIDEVTAKRNPR